MILRIFATDGFTPERIFRWSVEETAAHLCEQQVLWVTRLDGPWRSLVDWFLKQPCCRSVVLDHADRWGWYVEHEITWRIAQGLYFQQEPEAVCWIHDDMAPPSGSKFKTYLKDWLASRSSAMEAQAYQLWDSFDMARLDGEGGVKDAHCWLAKWSQSLRWLDGDNPACKDRFWPVEPVDMWVSPWPFRHAKGVDRDFREGRGYDRREFCSRVPPFGKDPECCKYDQDTTWDEFKVKMS